MSTTDEQRLLPCPFCGDDAATDSSYQAGVYYGCRNCEVWKRGADAWNVRAQQAPTPAVPTEPPHCPQCNTASLQLRCTHCFADFPVPPTASEPAAPVDAWDGLEQLFDLAKQYGYKLIPTPRAALARQAAAPVDEGR